MSQPESRVLFRQGSPEWPSYPARKVTQRHGKTRLAPDDTPGRMVTVECGHYIGVPNDYAERDEVPCGECALAAARTR